MFGLNHRTAPLAIRERVGISKPDLPDVMAEWKTILGLKEFVVLSTCNRMEVFGVAQDRDQADHALRQWQEWLRVTGRLLPDESSIEGMICLGGSAAFRHLMRVGAGLDSMVVGEAQILGQLKDAFTAAQAAGTAGPVCRRLFNKAFGVIKRVRTNTEIGRHPVSVSSVAVQVAEKIFGSLADRSVLLMGTGKISEVTARALVLRGTKSIAVAGRQEEKARAVAEETCGYVLPWDQVEAAVGTSDIVMVATGAPHYLLTMNRMGDMLKARRGRPLLIVDLSVPRNVEPSLADLEGVFLYNIDDLQTVTEANADLRSRHVAQAEAMVDTAVAEWVTRTATEGRCPFWKVWGPAHAEPSNEALAGESLVVG